MAFTARGAFLPWDPLRAVKTTPCAACGKAEAAAKCGACKFAKYCSQECQRRAWPAHQPLCKLGYNGYIASVERRQQRVGKILEIGGNHDSVLAIYRAALAESRAFGDLEGVRHILRVMTHRCDAIGRDSDAATYKAEADTLEDLLGASISAKHVFSQVECGKVGPQPHLDKIPTRTAQPRGHKTGILPWCRWEQSINDMTLTVALPPDVRKASLSISFIKQRLRIAITGGVVIADIVLSNQIKPDECSWTLSEGPSSREGGALFEAAAVIF